MHPTFSLLFSLSTLLVVQCIPISDNTEVNDAAEGLANALNTFVNAKGNELMEVVEEDVGAIKGDIDDHSLQLLQLEEELQTLSETGSIVGCKGVLHAGHCYFLVNQRYSSDSAALSCGREDASLATMEDQGEVDAVHSYVIHTDQVTDKSAIFVWTGMHTDDTSDVLTTATNWLPGFPSDDTTASGVIWQIMSDDFYLYHDGFLNAHTQVLAYPLCKKYVVPDVNECVDHNGTLPCLNDATCVNTPTSFECQCTDGWMGDVCSLDIDECTSNTSVCGVESESCTNIPGSFQCNCNLGFDGQTCDNNCALGMVSGEIEDSQLSVSSVWGDMYADSGAQSGRLHSFTASNFGAWTANTNQPGGAVATWTEVLGTSESPQLSLHISFPSDYAAKPTVASVTAVGDAAHADIFSVEVDHLDTDGMDITVTRIDTEGHGWAQNPVLTVVLHDATPLASAEWYQVEFPSPTNITGIITQGRGDQDQWVTKFIVYYGDDVNSLQTFTNQDGVVKFDGNSDRTTLVGNTFPDVISARVIRIYPIGWYQYVSMRLELLDCQ